MDNATESDRWAEIKAIFASAIDLPADERPEFVRSACKGDGRLLSEVESWLDSYTASEAFLEDPAISHDAFGLKASMAGREFGHYTIESEIGRGGMGAVYLATRNDGEFDQQVALKIVRQTVADSHVIERFRQERQILASLNHPNIAGLLDGGVSAEGEPFIAMEYVDGHTLLDFAAANRLGIKGRLNLFLKVCAALTYAHQNLVVHRDIKPGNILVDRNGEPKLLDFGLAKLIDESLGSDKMRTQTVFRALTPAYASPEQLRGEQITTASDVYALGVVLYELLTGTRPFQFDGKNLDEIIRTVATTDPSAPSANPRSEIREQMKGDLDNIVLKALRPEPERRYTSVEQFADDIRRYLAGLPVIARRATLYYTATKFARRHRVAVVAGFLILTTVATGVTLTVREKRKADRRFNDVRRLANSLIFEVDSEIQKGPTKGRAMIAQAALEYLDSLTQESGNEDDLLLELAAGYLKVGDIQGKPYRPNLGDTIGAETSYEKARVILQTLVDSNPASLEARRFLSLAHQSLGRVQQRNDKWDAALDNEGRAVELSEAIVAAAPSNAAYRSLLADNYVQYGAALYQTGRGATIDDHHLAIEYFRKALDIHNSLTSEDPENAEHRYAAGVDYEFVGIAFNRLGDLTGDIGHYRTALENHLKEFEINQALAASDPSNAAYRRIVADAYGEVGLSQLKLGNTAEGLLNYRRRLAIFESVRASDPSNVEAARDLINTLVDIGKALAKNGNTPEALTQFQKAVTLQHSVVAAEPANAEARDALARLTNITTRLEKTGRLE